MAIDIKNLEVGSIYEIDPTRIGASGLPGINSGHTFQLRDNNVRFILINDKTKNSLFTEYKITPLDDKLQPRDLGTGRQGYYGPATGPNGIVNFGTRLNSLSNIPIIKKINLSPAQKAAIGETELNKQRAYTTQAILSEKGVPSTTATGPLGNILEMAGIKTPKSKFGGKKTRKAKKSKRKTHKRR